MKFIITKIFVLFLFIILVAIAIELEYLTQTPPQVSDDGFLKELFVHFIVILSLTVIVYKFEDKHQK